MEPSPPQNDNVVKSVQDINGYSTKEILSTFVLPELRDLSDKLDKFICEDYRPFKNSTNKWRYLVTGALVFLSILITTIGTLAAIYGNLVI
jgi:hypothetical protein